MMGDTALKSLGMYSFVAQIYFEPFPHVKLLEVPQGFLITKSEAWTSEFNHKAIYRGISKNNLPKGF